MKRIALITGSSKGIGFALARAFLEKGLAVVICGRTENTLKEAESELKADFGEENVLALKADVSVYEENVYLWNEAQKKYGKVDIWVNNAGIGQSRKNIWELNEKKIKAIVDINISGHLFGMKVASEGMVEQGYGAIYNLEGLGSNDSVIKGTLVYSMSKRAIRYMTKSFSKELKGTGVITGSFRPGMTATDFIYDSYKDKPEEWKRMRPLFNILSDEPLPVARWFVKKALSNKKNGALFNWFTKAKFFFRLITSPFIKREIYKKEAS